MSEIKQAASGNDTDDFLGQNLPGWLKDATPVQLSVLRQCFDKHKASQDKVHQALGRLASISEFAQPLYEQALYDQLGVQVDLRQTDWRDVLRDFNLTLGAPLPEDQTKFVFQPALHRLLKNFGTSDGEDDGFYLGTALVTKNHEQVLFDLPERLARMCRALDVGQRYQAHLKDVFDKGLLTDLAQDKASHLLLASTIAYLKGHIDATDLRMLEMAANRRSPIIHGWNRVNVFTLNLFGCPVEGALLFEVRGAPNHLNVLLTIEGPVLAVMLYLPDAPGLMLRRCESWSELAIQLRNWIKLDESQAFLIQRVALRQRPAFVSLMQQRLMDATPDLQLAGTLLTGEPFAHLAEEQVKRIREDARIIAVPTAEVESSSHRARVRALEAVGLTVLNLAGVFVPTLGAVLVTQLVVQTLGEAFAGVSDWVRGRQHEALDHLLGVAETVAVSVAVAGGAQVVARAFARSGFVEGLHPVELDNGEKRLWSNDLRAYQQTALPEGVTREENGLYALAGRQWLAHRGAVYEVRQAQGQWRILHPTETDTYQPVLQFNGQRGWRLGWSSPLEWAGQSLLLSTVWPQAEVWGSETIRQILQVADVDEDQLRGLLVENRPLPVSLRDTLERFEADRRVTAFFDRLATGEPEGLDQTCYQYCLGQFDLRAVDDSEIQAELLDHGASLRPALFEHLASRYLPGDSLLSLLRRDFPTLPQAYALHLLQQLDEGTRLFMLQNARLPLRVAEQVRPLLRAATLNRMLEGLYLHNSHNLDTVRLVFALLQRHAGWPDSASLALYENRFSGSMLARLASPSSGHPVKRLVYEAGLYSVYGADGQAIDLEVTDPAQLVDVLLAVLPTASRERLGWGAADGARQMSTALVGWLPGDRQKLTYLLGLPDMRPWFNPGQRLADGRVGYLLSGRGMAPPSVATLRERIRALFPGFSETQVDAYLLTLRAQPGQAMATLLRREDEYRSLDRALSSWVASQPPVASSSRTLVTSVHQRVADELRRCWRRLGEPMTDNAGLDLGMRLSLVGMRVESLPTLPEQVDFSHVSDLVLVGLGLQRLPEHFLRHFPHVRWLNLSNNAFSRVPRGLTHLSRLRSLRLNGNRVVLDAIGVNVIAGLHQLRRLDLADNPLGRVRLELRTLRRLRELFLRRTGLRLVPSGILGCPFLEHADLRYNQIDILPAAVLEAPAYLREALVLDGNPLPAEVVQSWRQVALAPGGAVATAAADSRSLWLATLTEADRGERGEQWDLLRNEPGSDEFFNLLGELTRTSDYERTRDDLSRRVWQVIDAARSDGELRRRLFTMAIEGHTCVDGFISRFSHLETQVLVTEALADGRAGRQPAALLKLARRLFRLDLVEQIARDTVAERVRSGSEGGVDAVEISLAFRVGLARTLDLPGQPSSYRFTTLANVSEGQLATAASTVEAAERTDALPLSISTRDFWRAYLRQQQPLAFEQVEQPFIEQLDDLTEAAAEINEGEYLLRMNQLGSERQAAIDALILRLTRLALAALATQAP
ncbi:NEL-type E3 ubiquitin ligase domain-containing protein [Pseudomonas sp. NPDC090755]|uniref:NEL-type E3 ubiquitin ligase domain-containing protein n=1 Tax=Pseudomonas sp. NPDC090755 TaxID=3364481 RepID=UPI00383AC4F5